MRPLWLCCILHAAVAHADPRTLDVEQGGIGRWSGGDARSCRFEGRTRAAIEGNCYFPIDMARAAGRYPIAKVTDQGTIRGHVQVIAVAFPEQSVELPDTMAHYIHPSADQLARGKREAEQVMALFYRDSGPPQFTLPLAPPHQPLPEGKDFGHQRIFNGVPKAAHSGVDYAIGDGQPVHAAADGTVALTGDHFFTGKVVYLNHGDRLVTEYFHLGDITVEPGQHVKRGDRIGTVGSTGRSTGPHLHFGVRWHGMRIDPQRLLAAPDELPTLE